VASGVVTVSVFVQLVLHTVFQTPRQPTKLEEHLIDPNSRDGGPIKDLDSEEEVIDLKNFLATLTARTVGRART
jgi:hypothetical protein